MLYQKKDGSHRIILDLSSPRGSSINEYISRSDYSVRYTPFDEAVSMVSSFPFPCFMAKLDIKHAFRLCPVHPTNWSLLDYCWDNYFFVDTRLPFGSRSSPYIFNKFADALVWILIYVFGIRRIIHYLDDFFICSSSFESCEKDMRIIKSAFLELGVPLAPDKIIGPSTTITYLGIEIDTSSRSIRLPDEKFHDLQATLNGWLDKRKCTKRELLSLIGSLSFACKVVKPGRIFLRRLIDLSMTVTSINHHITLNSEARADITWWLDFLPSWNGREFFQSEPITSYAIKLFTDASLLGFGAVFDTRWFSVPWPNHFSHFHINFLELFAIVACVFTWGDEWRNKQILFYTDNQVITHIWKTGTSTNKDIMRLVRALFLFSARRNINILMVHIAGSSNVLADSLSRLQVDRFHQLHPSAAKRPTPISSDVWLL